ncbi:hypothetical protein HNQ60_002662 [Povalibacter uvarum]|uniref:Uncharacterized protein n=1 Tax=Povalibacter uvarum TaxID=732238 RepID=A0A841HKQ4_9GAMM|nr:DUF6454 family protein [Povalibacter uvarum]MBB6093781.1 hypothetical protein [Povalibacter uvarum]
MKSAVVLASILLLAGHAQAVSAHDGAGEWRKKFRDNETTQLFRLIGKNAIWTQVGTVTTDFANFHTQGLVKVGDVFYVSAVEVLESTVRNGAATDSLYDFTIDRSTGAGRGWLFKFDATGHLLGKVELTNGTKYHPGGIDFDGRHLWVSVAEYRPNSQTDIYRVDPRTLEAQRIFSEKDHIGGIVHNVHAGTLHGVSWGSRRLYTWEVAKRGGRAPRVVSSDWIPNPQFYVDYQDCHYQGIEYMLCGGVGGYSSPLGNFAFGGIDLVDLRTGRMEHQVPVNRFIDEGNGPSPGLSLSHNAFWLEPLGNGKMRGYFMTESDNQAELLIYDITPWINRQ